MTAQRLPRKDVVIIGLGWTGSIMAKELTDEGSTSSRSSAVHGATRRPTSRRTLRRTNCATASATNSSFSLARRPSRSATRWIKPPRPSAPGARSCRRTASAAAACTGTRRPGASCRPIFMLKSHLTQRYGAKFLPEDMTIQDWGVTYDELEPYYDRFEYLCGTSGTAGNLNGQIQPGGNPFEGPRSRPYPNPAQQQPFSHALFAKAAQGIGYKPFPQPSGNLSQAYMNPLGVRMGPCTYCGFCEWFGCGNFSKASPQTTLLPVLVRKPNFTARDQCEVTRINGRLLRQARHGRHVVDDSGNEWEQPADLVILSRVHHIQRPAPAALRDRNALRPRGQPRRDRPQFHAPDHFRRRELLRQIEIHLQPLHRLGLDRHVHRRVQRRQFRPRPARLRRRRLHGPGADQRPADRNHAGASRGRRVGAPSGNRRCATII